MRYWRRAGMDMKLITLCILEGRFILIKFWRADLWVKFSTEIGPSVLEQLEAQIGAIFE